MPLSARVLLACLCACAAAAQTPHLVLTHLPTNNPAAQLVEVDATTGVPQPLGRFPSDALPPLALTIDPCDGSPLVAVELPTGISRIVRLVPTGTGFAEFHVADL